MTSEVVLPVETSFRSVFAQALRGQPCSVVGLGHASPLPVDEWARPADDVDDALLAGCRGATLDIGCGPGRLAARLLQRGHVVLGIDVVPEAVRQTLARGAPALERDVFGPVPGEGLWATALLADGNIGIGGDPVALLRRVRGLVRPGGRVVVELAGPGQGLRSVWASLQCGPVRSRPFRWSVVGCDAIGQVAASAGLDLDDQRRHGHRWSAVLRSAA